MRILLLQFILLSGPCLNSVNQSDTMLTYNECLKMAREKLVEISENDPNYVIWEAQTIEKEYGWVFATATKQYIKTKDPSTLVPGIAQIVVNKVDSSCFMVSSSRSLDASLKEYEESLSDSEKK